MTEKIVAGIFPGERLSAESRKTWMAGAKPGEPGHDAVESGIPRAETDFPFRKWRIIHLLILPSVAILHVYLAVEILRRENSGWCRNGWGNANCPGCITQRQE